jgi:hypothetical protein
VKGKDYLIIILSIAVFGIIISLVYNGVSGFFNIMPFNGNVSESQLLSECARTASVYSAAKNEANRKDFCCTSLDLNNDGIISSNEYCAKAYEKIIDGNSVAVLCSNTINYYSNYALCDNQ